MARKSESVWKAYRISILVAASVGVGFWTAHMDGAGLDAVLRSALILALVMIVFFAAGTLWQMSRHKRAQDKKDR